MAAKRYSYGVRIAGIGSDTTKTGGQCWYTGNRLSTAQKAASNYEWVGGPLSRQGLVDLPDGSDSSVSLWTAGLSLSSIGPRLHLDDAAGRALMKRVLEPIGWLDEDITTTETSIVFSAGMDDVGLEGTVVFVGDEAIRLDTKTATATFTVTRAMWGTRAQELPRYVRVFDGPPYRKAREVTLIRYDHADDSETTMWFGLLDDAPSTSEEHTTLDLSATEALAAVREGRVNKGAPDLSKETSPVNQTPAFTGSILAGRVSGEVRPDPVRVRNVDATAGTAHNGAFQVGESLCFGTWIVAKTFYTMRWTHTGRPMLGSPAFEEDDEPKPVHELLVIVRELDEEDGVKAAAADMWSSTAGLAYPFNPIAVWLAMTIDHPDYNVLGPEWNLGAPADWFDLTDIEATIAATAHIKIDRLVLGWDGEEVEPWEHFKVWCATYGLFPCIRPDGRISVRQSRTPGPAEVFGAPTVTALPFRLHWRPSEADGVDILSGRYNILPWYDGDPFKISLLDFSDPANPVPQFSKRGGLAAGASQAQFDMPTRADDLAIVQALNGMAATRHIGVPKLGIKAHDDGFGHGDFVRLAPLDTRDNELRDSTGERVAVDDSANWVGLVVSKRSEFEHDRASIDMHLSITDGRFPRFRSATAKIQSASGATMTLEEGIYVPGGDDGAEFTAADKVQIWNGTTYERRSTEVLTISAINPHEIVFTTTPTTTPVAGDLIELAFLSTASGYPETGNPNAYSGLAYAYMGDDAHTIGPNDLEAHIYGGSQ